MASYRMYFLTCGRIRAAENFEADYEIDAIRMARALWDACSDVCEAFELWQGPRLVRTRPPPYRGASLSYLSEAPSHRYREGRDDRRKQLVFGAQSPACRDARPCKITPEFGHRSKSTSGRTPSLNVP